MSFQQSISKLKNKAKARLPWRRLDPGASEAGSGKVEPTNSHLQPDPHVGVVEGGEHFDSRNGGSDGMYAWLVHVTPTNDHHCPDNSIDPDHDRVLLGKNQQSASGDSREGQKFTGFHGAELLLRTVRDSTDAFPPLKSVAGGLCFILENYEVRVTSRTSLGPRCLEFPQQPQQNKESIQFLAPRVGSLAGSLCVPVAEGDIGDKLRREILER